MVKLTKRLAIYVGSFVLLTALYTAGYRWGMAALEGEKRTWYQAFEIVVQSMTTTGYGQDAPWETLEMTALMILIQVTGIAYIVVAIPQFVIPWIETIVEPSPPEDVAELDDHVIVVGYTGLCDSIVDELEGAGVDYVVVETDDERARELYEDGIVVLHGDPATAETLEAAQLDDARAVVVDATEREFLGAVIAIDDREPAVELVALVADPARARYLRYAGADEILSPKHRLGKALGDKVRSVVDVRLGEASASDARGVDSAPDDGGRDDAGGDDGGRGDAGGDDGGRGDAGGDDGGRGDAGGDADGPIRPDGTIDLGAAWNGRSNAVGTNGADETDESDRANGANDDRLRLVEFPVAADSDLVGEPLATCRRLEVTGATVLGVWARGEFFPALAADVRVDEFTRVLAVGRDEDLALVAETTGSSGSPYRPEREPIVVVGTGVVGSSVAGDLERAGLETVVVDRADGELVDVVGDVTTEETLAAAGVGDAETLVLAIDEDEVALVATLVARELDGEGVEILAATDRNESVPQLRAAGADYVLGLPSVAGRMVTQQLFDRAVMRFEQRIGLRTISVVDLDAPGDELDPGWIRDRTGCSPVAVLRGGRPYTDLDALELRSDDRLLLAGADDQLEQFFESHGP